MDVERIVNIMPAVERGEPAEVAASMSPVPPQEIQQAATNMRTLERRTFGKIALGGVVVALGGARFLQQVNNDYTSIRWPAAPARIDMVPGSDRLARGGEEYLVAMGFGQQDAMNASHELYSAINEDLPVASLRYPSVDFMPEDLARVVAAHIRVRRMSKLNIVGSSAGFIMMLRALQHVYPRNVRQPGRTDTNTNGQQTGYLPRINQLIAYSSPSNWESAIQQDTELGKVMLAAGEKYGYHGDTAGKLIYDLTDQSRNNPDLSQTLPGLRTLLYRTFQEVNNNCPPGMCWGMFRQIVQFDIRTQGPQYGGIVAPSTEIIYTAPNHDLIVADRQSERDYAQGLRKNVMVLSTGNTNHANTLNSSLVIGEARNDLTALADAGKLTVVSFTK